MEEFNKLVRDIEVETHQDQLSTPGTSMEIDEEEVDSYGVFDSIDYLVQTAQSALDLEKTQDKGVKEPEENYPTPPYGSPNHLAALLAAPYRLNNTVSQEISNEYFDNPTNQKA
ncbi:hypothetical protein BDW59DRAFT_168127 [Aspergillus cavernicola]|uniref:Uncharacterized protein n=1 Tax=Aspergillus cavernicola TaxID=176166 RepID=A0ABR4H4W6_9EURO